MRPNPRGKNKTNNYTHIYIYIVHLPLGKIKEDGKGEGHNFTQVYKFTSHVCYEFDKCERKVSHIYFSLFD